MNLKDRLNLAQLSSIIILYGKGEHVCKILKEWQQMWKDFPLHAYSKIDNQKQYIYIVLVLSLVIPYA